MSRHTPRFALLLLLLLGAASSASAQADAVESEVLVVLGEEKEGGIDPSLASVRALQRPPFSAYKTMKVLSRKSIKLIDKAKIEVVLPNGRKLHLVLLERLKDGRYRVEVAINRPDKKDYLKKLAVKASPGKHFFMAGQKHQGGTLIIGVRVGKGPASKASKPAK